MRIIGIDPGSRITGYAIIDVLSDGTKIHIDSGAIPLKPDDIPTRLVLLQRELSRLIAEHRPTICAIEAIFVHKNPNSALKLGQARGVALCTVACAEIPIFEYAPRAIKQAVTGQGGAEKTDIQAVIQGLFGLEGKIQPDRADAIAIALAHHALFYKLPEMVEQSPKRRKKSKEQSEEALPALPDLILEAPKPKRTRKGSSK